MSYRSKYPYKKYQQFNKFDRNGPKGNNYYSNNYNDYKYGNYYKYNNYNGKKNYYYYNTYNYNNPFNNNYYYKNYKKGKYPYYTYYREVEVGEKNEIDEKFVEELKKIGYFIKEVKGDGNCLFRSVSDQMEENENNYEEYRKKCVEYMKENKDDFSPFLEEEEPIDTYIEKMSKNGEWGGNLEIYALSKALNCNFYIYIYEMPIYVVKNWEDPIKDIMLTYHNGKHYNSLRRIKENDNEEKNKEKDLDKEKEQENKEKDEEKNKENKDIKENEEKGKKIDDASDLISKVNHLNI